MNVMLKRAIRKTSIAFLILVFGVAGFSLRQLVAHAQIGSSTHQRIKASASPEYAQAAKLSKPKKSNVSYAGTRALTIGEDQELTFPADLKECRVFDSKTLEKAVLQATSDLLTRRILG